MAEKMEVELDLNNAAALRKSQAFQRSLGGIGRTGVSAAGGMFTAFSKLGALFPVIGGMAGIGGIAKAIQQTIENVRIMDMAVDRLWQKAQQRMAQTAQELGSAELRRFMTVMPEPYASSEALSRQYLARQAGKYMIPTADVMRGEFTPRSEFIGKAAPQLPGAIEDTLTMVAGGKVTGEEAGNYMAMLKGVYGMESREQRQLALAQWRDAAAASTGFDTSMMGQAMILAGPTMEAAGISYQDQLAIAAATASYYPGKPRRAGMFMRGAVIAGLKERTEYTKQILQSEGVDPDSDNPVEVIMAIARHLQKGGDKKRLVAEGGWDDRVVQGMLNMSTGGFERKFTAVGAVTKKSSYASILEMNRKYRRQESAQIRAAQEKRAIPRAQPAPRGSVQEVTSLFEVMRGELAEADPFITAEDERRVSELLESGPTGWGDNITEEQRKELLWMDRDYGVAMTNWRNVELAAKERGNTQLEAYARYQQLVLGHHRRRALDPGWDIGQGTTPQDIAGYKNRLRESFVDLLKLERGTGGKTRQYLGYSGLGGLDRGGRYIDVDLPGGYQEDIDLQWKTPAGKAVPIPLPTQERMGIAPGNQQSYNANMQIFNFDHTPQSTNRFTRGGWWGEADPMGYA